MYYGQRLQKSVTLITPEEGDSCRLNVDLEKDCLRTLCEGLGITLLYRNMRPIIFTYTVSKGRPVFIADHIFENCPKKIAQAIIGYYLNYRGSQKYGELIRGYIYKNLKPGRFKIRSADDRFKYFFRKYYKSICPNRPPEHKLIEAKILSIIQRGFRGGTRLIKSGEPIRLASSGPLDLEIKIEYPTMEDI